MFIASVFFGFSLLRSDMFVDRHAAPLERSNYLVMDAINISSLRDEECYTTSALLSGRAAARPKASR